MSSEQWRIDQLTEDDIIESIDVIEFSPEQRSDISELVRCMSPIDRDIVYLCIYRGVKQTRVALMLGVSQGDVSYRLRRAIEILKSVKVGYFCKYRELVGNGKIDLSREDQSLYETYLLLRKQTVAAGRHSVSQSTASKRINKINIMLQQHGINLM